MAYVNVSRNFKYPDFIPQGVSTTPNTSNVTSISTAGQKYCMIFQPSVSKSIAKVGFRIPGVTTGTTTCDVRVETVDTTTGAPTGTLVGTNTNGNINITTAGWYEATLTSNASVTMGTYYSITIAPSGSFNFNLMQFSDETNYAPYLGRFDGTAWAFSQIGVVLSIEYSDGTFENNAMLWQMNTVSTETYGSSTSPNVRGNKITIPFDCKCDGVWIWADLDGNANVTLYDTDGTTQLANAVMYTNTPPVASAGINYVMFDAEVTLAAGSTYYLGVRPTTTTSMTMYAFTLNSSNINPYANNVIWSQANNPTGTGSWTDTNTKIALVGLLISQVDDGAGTGGSTPSGYSFMC